MTNESQTKQEVKDKRIPRWSRIPSKLPKKTKLYPQVTRLKGGYQTKSP